MADTSGGASRGSKETEVRGGLGVQRGREGVCLANAEAGGMMYSTLLVVHFFFFVDLLICSRTILAVPGLWFDPADGNCADCLQGALALLRQRIGDHLLEAHQVGDSLASCIQL